MSRMLVLLLKQQRIEYFDLCSKNRNKFMKCILIAVESGSITMSLRPSKNQWNCIKKTRYLFRNAILTQYYAPQLILKNKET